MNRTQDSSPDSRDRDAIVRARSLMLVALAWVLAYAVACGKTEYANGVVGPTATVAACEQSIRPSAQSVPAAGGNFVVEIATGAGCDWTALSDDTWITVTGGSGSGPGSAAYVVQRNAGSSTRQGRVRVGDFAVSITQAAAEGPGVVGTPPPPAPAPVPPAPDDCELTATPTSITVADAGGTSEIVVTIGSRCRWEATTDAEWVRVAPASGVGPARVSFDIAANAGSTSRAADVRIGEATVRVTQSPRPTPSCESIRMDPETQASGVDGGSFRASVSAPTNCGWTAVSDNWIAVSPTSGSGSASLSYTVAANEALPRSGTIRIGTAVLKLTQEGCSLTLSQSSRDVTADGGRFSVDVMATGTACKWTASAGEPWIEVLSSPGRGKGTASFAVAANTSAPRTGRIRIGEQSMEIRQAGPLPSNPCPESVAPGSASFAATGGEAKFSVTAATDCKWSAVADAAWITVAAGSGAGSGGGTFSVRPNDGPERSGRIRIGERAIEIRQAAVASRPCPESVAPAAASFPVTGGEAKFSVTATTDCKWSASADAAWITITAGTGAGSGTGTYSVRPNDGPERTGRIRIGERAIEIRQEAVPVPPRACPESVAPTSASFTATGGEAKFSVTAASDCKWAASADVAWIAITTGTGAGSGTGTYSVRPNDGPERTGRIRIGDRAIDVRQAAAPPRSCPESVAPASASFSASGADDKFSVTAAADCKWAAAADVSWIVIVSGTGAGSGGGAYSVRPNDGPERSGRIRIGERAIEIRQAAAPPRSCPESVTPSSASAPATASEGRFSVTAAPTCKWSASADVPWIVTTSSGAGTGSGGYSVLANPGSTRSGRIRIGDQAITVTQAPAPAEPACTYSIDLAPGTFNPKGDTLTIVVTTQARCTWGMKTDVDWITPRSASGTGSGKVGATVQANTGRPREATIIVNDRSFTVRQPGL